MGLNCEDLNTKKMPTDQEAAEPLDHSRRLNQSSRRQIQTFHPALPFTFRTLRYCIKQKQDWIRRCLPAEGETDSHFLDLPLSLDREPRDRIKHGERQL
jgi:hypothetical protein